jgi:hypothetical protein
LNTGSKGKLTEDKKITPTSPTTITTTTTTTTTTTNNTLFKKFGGKNMNLTFINEDVVKKSMEEIRNSKTDIKWIVFEYCNDNSFKLELTHKGKKKKIKIKLN